MIRSKLRAAFIGVLLSVIPLVAMAQPTTETTLPPPFYDASQRVQVQPLPTVQAGRDSITNHWCVPGATATCVPIGGGGGGTASLAPWLPDNGSLQTLAPTASASASSAFAGSGTTVYIKNIGTVSFHVRAGVVGVTAALTDERLQPGMCGPFLRNGGDRVSLITDGGTGSAEVTTGTGNPGFGICTNITSPSVIAGADGSTAASLTNPSPTGPVAQPGAGMSTASTIAANNTTSVAISAAPATLYATRVGSIGATGWLKLYDALQANVTCGSGTPKLRILIPANSTAANGAGNNIVVGGGLGVKFSTGITKCVVVGIADNDTTAPAASTIVTEADYK